jgi:amidohydrolase
MLGAAKILNELKEDLHGTVKIIFQEAEETGQGADRIIESGLLDGVDEFFGLHGSQRMDLGSFALGYGVMSTYGGGIIIDIQGKGGHSSRPHKTVNPLIVATEIISAVENFAAYGFDSFDQVVLVPTVLHTGTKSNVIPETAHLEINYRFFDIKYKDILEKGVFQLAQNIAAAYGATIQYSFFGPGTVVNNDKDSVDRAIRLIKANFGEEAVVIATPGMGGEDFSRYQLHAPGVFISVGAARDGVYEQGHTDKTLMDDESLKYGEKLLLYYVLDYLNESQESKND